VNRRGPEPVRGSGGEPPPGENSVPAARPSPPSPPPRPPRPSNPRRVAVDILLEWQTSGTYADALLATADQRHRFANSSDRALLHALVLGVLRHKTMLDIWIAELNLRGRLTDPVRWILRLGLFQLLKMGVAEHAAVDESVNLTYEEKPLVNAILRRAIDEKEHLLAIEEDAPVHERYSLPDFLVERWRWLFGEDGMRQLTEMMGQPSETFVRLNRLKPWDEVPVGLAPVEGVPDFFRAADVPRAALEEGRCYVQDPSTWTACALLAPEPGQTVLDACAAPGGKAAILAQMMGNTGRLVATDTSSRRLKRLSENLLRLGVTNAECRVEDWTATEVTDDGVRYDRILLDVPCSNTGVMRRRVDVRWRVTPAVVAEMADVQWRILAATIPRLAPGGRLVYSTCSLEPAENDVQVERVLAAYPHLRLLEKKLIMPHETGFDGAYAALFEAL
jgi:16S rRNA (cytosine967-C5)-methyltransferase